MGKRRNKSLLEVLAVAPWWVNVALAALAYTACTFAPTFVHAESPVFAGLNILASLLQKHGHFVALPFLVLAVIAAANALWRRRLLDRQSGIEDIRNLSWREFELLVGEAFRRQGYSIEETGGGGADGGIDLILRREGEMFIVQCKRWKNRQVGVAAVRELYGVMTAAKARGAFFVSSGTYTPDARQFASETGVELIDGEGLQSLVKAVKAVPDIPDPIHHSTEETTKCPTCGSLMVLRTARRGKNAGADFWGCPSFPACRSVIPYQA